MNIKTLFLGAILAVLTLTSCEEDTWGCTEGNGYKSTRYVDPYPFTEVDIDIRADTYISQGNEYEVRIVASENIINDIHVEVRQGELNIYTSGGCVTETEGKIKVYITAPNFEKLSLNSSGSISNESFLDLNDLSIYVNGSCDVDLDNIAVDDYDLFVGGSGDVRLQGETADQGSILMSSSGNVNVSNLYTNTLDIEIKSSGDAEVFVNASIEATLSGSGNLTYQGNPSISSIVTGSGKIYHEQ